MTLPMPDEEIRTRYRWMAPSQNRVQILADLNGCRKEMIEEVLQEMGEKKYKKWTEEDVEMLIRMMVDKYDVRDIAERLGRTVQQVKSKAYLLGKEEEKKAELAVPVVEPPVELVINPADPTPEGYVDIEIDYLEAIKEITERLNKIVEYSNGLRKENDRLTRQLAAVRQAVE